MYLFDDPNLVGVLRSRGVKLGVATSVASELWEAAEVHPVQINPMLELSEGQRRMLSVFGSAAVC